VFPLTIINYVKLGIFLVLLLGAGYVGYALESARFDRYKTAQITQTQKAQEQHQEAADRIRKDKDAQINSINAQLVDAISELRKRPNRAQDPSNGSCGTGATLSAEDAEFLIREAARADQIRAGLSACYQQYDALTQ